MKQNMKLLSISTATIAAATLLTALPAQAYVGPGAGLSLLSALWAVLAAVFVAVGFVLLWPIRKMMRKRKRAQQNTTGTNTASTTHSAPSEQPKA
ncbi:hypothetical protein [Thalassospira sp. MCCC 1A03138]|uniref:hypothetical protein n=1 Tax=Thalassospira sp. MCCC 1A03138 TaxID=1470576 RepID=UPI000A1E0BFF|nr:hypothetical protein [Thalassospira sp. MCCC 1A03138]OSQ32593.1 hypothetical protein TH468_03265 [Thalassospira sp. MCCC 1A03138]